MDGRAKMRPGPVMPMRHMVLLLAIVSWSLATTPSPYVLFGLRNPSSVDDQRIPSNSVETSTLMTAAVNNWLWAAPGSAVPFEAPQQQQGIVAVQAVPLFFVSNSDVPSIDRVLSSQLELLMSVWENGTVPVLDWHPSIDYNLDCDAFESLLAASQGQYNDYITSSGVFDMYVSRFSENVLVPFLSANSTDTGMSGVRRIFINFAPDANTQRYPWSLNFAMNTTSRGLLEVNQSAASYTRLWSHVVGTLVLNSTALIDLAKRIVVPGDQDPATAHEKLQLAVQLIWTSSAQRVNPRAEARLEDLMPSWPGMGGHIYGATWFGVSAAVVPSSGDSASSSSSWVNLPSPPEEAVMPVLDNVLALASAANSTLRRLPSLSRGSPIPVAVLSLGATALDDALVPRITKGLWIADMLNYLVWGASASQGSLPLAQLVHMVVYQNTLYYNGSLGWRNSEGGVVAHMQILSFDDDACCPDVAVFTQAASQPMDVYTCEAVKDRLIDLVFGLTPVAYLPQAPAARIISDAAFVGGLDVTLPPIPPRGSPSKASFLADLFHRPLTIASAAVIGAVLMSFILWRLVSQRRKARANRLILQRYMCCRILRRRKGIESSALVEAVDIKQNQKVIVKQFIVISDYVSVLANNEIEKLRAAQGSDHVAQLVQTAFAWKTSSRQVKTSSRSATSKSSSPRVLSEADCSEGAASDSNPMLAKVQYNSVHDRLIDESAVKSHLAATGDATVNDGSSGKFPYALLVMKKYSSGDLEQFIRLAKSRRSLQSSAYTGIAIHDALSIFAQLLRALHFLHCLAKPKDPMMHRDVKPENIFLERRRVRGEKDQWAYLAFLGDFGVAAYRSQVLAAVSSSSKVSTVMPSTPRCDQQQQPAAPVNLDNTRGSSFGIESADSYLSSRCIGTRLYMPPEARRGEYYTAGDIFSAGGVLLALLLAELPDDLSLAVQSSAAMAKMRADLLRECNCPAWLADMVLDQALALNPHQRPTALQMLSQLRARMSEKDRRLAGVAGADAPPTPHRCHTNDALEEVAEPTAAEEAAEAAHCEAIHSLDDVDDDDPDVLVEATEDTSDRSGL
jgi:serine/threonine protein kinase